MPTVFLSYRRRDTVGEAGHLADALQQRLGQRWVFRDVIGISPGDRFDEEIGRQLAAAEVVVVLIGPTWLEELRKRLAEASTDYHRVEVANALRERKKVIPVLLKGATLPSAEALPDDLRSLTKCQAMTVRDEAWSPDVSRLIDAVGRPYRWGLLGVRMLIVAVVVTLAVRPVSGLLLSEPVTIGMVRALWLSLFGTYGLFELSAGYRYFRRLKRLRRATYADLDYRGSR